MATVSFASAHTPVMQPPADELQPGSLESSGLDCANSSDQGELTNLMVQSLDAELGRLLTETGLGMRGSHGGLVYSPETTDTMVVIVGDNGSLGTTVKAPFDPTRAKGTAYQTGVWVPLVVAGPLVESPDRVVAHMVNFADLFELFGEIAGLDVHETVPRPLDSESMLPYLLDPDQASIRATNFTQVGPNLQANGGINGPCTIQNSCTQIPVTKGVCEDNGGIWWGPGADDPATAGIPAEGLARCCNVNAFRAAQGQSQYNITPESSVAVRNDRYKIVQNTIWEYESQETPCVENTDPPEFYEINEDVPLPRLDRAHAALPLDSLSPEEQANYDQLLAELDAKLALAPDCPGDGNIDFVVNGKDLGTWSRYSKSWGRSSVYDFNLDGITDGVDRAVIFENIRAECTTN